MRMRTWGNRQVATCWPSYWLTGRASILNCPDLISLNNDSSLTLMMLQRIAACSPTGKTTGPNEWYPTWSWPFWMVTQGWRNGEGASFLGLSIADQKKKKSQIYSTAKHSDCQSLWHMHTCTQEPSLYRLSKQLTIPYRMLVTIPQIPHLWN